MKNTLYTVFKKKKKKKDKMAQQLTALAVLSEDLGSSP